MKQVNIVDNKDGSPADVSVGMTFDGVRYAWDLSNANFEKLMKALNPWLTCAETSAVRGKAKASTNGHSSSTDEIRAWATENGFEVASRGRISTEVLDAYNEAHLV